MKKDGDLPPQPSQADAVTTSAPKNAPAQNEVRVRKDFSEVFLWDSFDVTTIE